MEPAEIQSFVTHYTPTDGARIQFAWNGKHDDDFEDENEAIREEILDAIADDLQAAPILLIRDLFRAETQFSREAWCIDDRVGQLAEQLLRRGDDRFVLDFLEGKSQSFDASVGSAFSVDLPLAEHLLLVVQNQLCTEPDPARIELLRQGEGLFQEWVASCRAKRA